MNIIVGMMMPLMNWAPERRVSTARRCFFSNSGLRLALAAEHLDQAVAGEGLLDDAVELDRCSSTAATKSFCDRLPIIAVTTMVIGMVTRAMRASSREIQNIIATIATTVSSEVSSWLSVCCRLCCDVVDVVGDPAEQLAARLAVEVGQRQAVELVLDIGPRSR